MHPSVTEFLNQVWANGDIQSLKRQNAPFQDIEDAIYDLYTPPAKGVPQNWTQIEYHDMPLGQMAWRVYISATPASLMKVWNALQEIFRSQPGIAAAKHTTMQAAATRVDTIVIYLRDRAAKDDFISSMRRLCQTRPGVGSAPPIPPRLPPGDFKEAIPPTTEQVEGLRGVAHAQQPLEDGWAAKEMPIPAQLSFGMQLSRMIAAALLRAASKPIFFTEVEAEFLEYGMDVNKPWQYLLTQSDRDQLVASGNASRRRRGYPTA